MALFSPAEVDYYLQSNQAKLQYLAGETMDYVNYQNTINTAQKAYADEQCRLLGLLQDSVDTGYNTVSSGTGSLDVQVCFRAGTPVIMADDSTKKIEKIVLDDLVFARPHDDPTGPLRVCRVTRLYHNQPKPIWKAMFDNGLFVEATLEHPFYVQEKGWVSLNDLQIGDSCVNIDGEKITLISKEFVTEEEPVYNFEVEDAHTYFVGTSRKDSVLVHNYCSTHGPFYAIGCDECLLHNNPRTDEPLLDYNFLKRASLRTVPTVLEGKWLVSIHSYQSGGSSSGSNGHAWITYHGLDENNKFNGKAYTTGTAKTGRMGHEQGGVHFTDMYSHEFLTMAEQAQKYKAGEIVSRSAVVEDPRPVGNDSYSVVFNNCSSHAVHVWELTTGECMYAGYFNTSAVTPHTLKNTINSYNNGKRYLKNEMKVDFSLPEWTYKPETIPNGN